MKSVFILLTITCICSPAFAADPKPLSLKDKEKIEGILKQFDPASFKVDIPYANKDGKVEYLKMGLAKVEQFDTKHGTTLDEATAGTINTNNIFAAAGTINTNNIFARTGAGTVNTNNIFASAAQKSLAKELNEILQQYK